LGCLIDWQVSINRLWRLTALLLATTVGQLITSTTTSAAIIMSNNAAQGDNTDI
jgi:hypothetical protein